jgi:hypothetical protein
VRQPHTCRSSKPKGVHAQNIAHYHGHHLVGMVRADSDISISSMIETIFGFTSHRVNYSKAWRGKAACYRVAMERLERGVQSSSSDSKCHETLQSRTQVVFLCGSHCDGRGWHSKACSAESFLVFCLVVYRSLEESPLKSCYRSSMMASVPYTSSNACSLFGVANVSLASPLTLHN